MKQLRIDQIEFIANVLGNLRARRATLGVAPTGSGKTFMGARIAKEFRRVVIVAHRREIIDQWREEVGFHPRCWIGGVMTALEQGPSRADLLIVDEAHRSAAKTYRQIIAKYRGAARLGLTATPLRTDGQGLDDAFDALVTGPSVASLMDQGVLVPFRSLEAPDEALRQLSHMKRVYGDYSQRELSRLMNQPRLVGDVVREYKKHGRGRPAVVFAVSREHSRSLEQAFRAARVRAAHIDGLASESARRATLADLAAGSLDVLCSVNLFTEGWDCPQVSCVILARPTASLTLHLQSVGRGMRACRGKRDLLILDHSGNLAKHGYPDEEREWALESAAQRAQREREEAERARLAALGFDSVDAELREKERREAALYTPAQIAKHFNIIPASVPRAMRGYGVFSAFLGHKGRSFLFDRAEIDGLVEKIGLSYTAAEAARRLGTTADGFRQIRRREGWPPLIGSGGYVRYLKTSIDRCADLRSSGYSGRDCRKLLGLTSVGMLVLFRRLGLKRLAIGKVGKQGYRYPKAVVDALLEKRAGVAAL